MTGPVHVIVWGGGRTLAPRAVLVHGTMTGGYGRARLRRAAAAGRDGRALVVDRRGFGASPDVDRSDYELDAVDIAGLMEGGAHLVGHSYGGVVAMLAAALARMRAAIAEAPAARSHAARLRAAATAMRGRPCWEADVLRVEGASHWPHAERPGVVNSALRRLWRRVAG